MKTRLLVACAAFLGGAVCAVGIATPTAASTYHFTASGGSIPGLASPGYGSVEVTTVGLDLKFDVEISSPNWLVDTGNATQHAPIEFALTTSGLQISSTPVIFTALPSPFSQGAGSSFTNSGFNTPVNYAIACASNGANGCNKITSLIFYVLAAGALSPILTDGVYITADIFAGNVLDPESGQLGTTGTVGATLDPPGGPPLATPLPAAVWLFGTVLAGGIGVGRWRKKRKAATSS